MLEYYDGIHFMTTNRQGSFDQAFRSRVHVSLHYAFPLPKTRLKLWQLHFDILVKEAARAHEDELSESLVQSAAEN